jgi:hypothetical protein
MDLIAVTTTATATNRVASTFGSILARIERGLNDSTAQDSTAQSSMPRYPSLPFRFPSASFHIVSW